MYCTLRTVVHFTWEMCALAVPLKLVQLGYKYYMSLSLYSPSPSPPPLPSPPPPPIPYSPPPPLSPIFSLHVEIY